MSEGTREIVPADRAEVSQLREEVQALAAAGDRVQAQLTVAAQNFAAITKVLRSLIEQGNASANGLAGLLAVGREHQAQIEGLAFIQRAGRREPTLQTGAVPARYDPLAGTPAAQSPFNLGGAPDVHLP